MSDIDVHIVAGGRKSGRTAALVQWVKEGEESTKYPYWTRVILVEGIHRAIYLRERCDLDPHQIYSFDEWRTAVNVNMDVEVAVDDAQDIIARFIGSNGRLRAISMMSTSVQQQTRDTEG